MDTAEATRGEDGDAGPVGEQRGGRDRRRAIDGPRRRDRQVAGAELGDVGAGDVFALGYYLRMCTWWRSEQRQNGVRSRWSKNCATVLRESASN
jgi:hypothetical protein